MIRVNKDGKHYKDYVDCNSVCQDIGIAKNTLHKYIDTNVKYKKKYSFERINDYKDKPDRMPKELFDRWGAMQKMFSNVKWEKRI